MNKKKYIIIFSSLIALIIVGAIYLISLDKDEKIIEETEVKEEVEIKEEVKVYEIKKKDDISKERQRFLDAIEAKADESAGGPHILLVDEDTEESDYESGTYEFDGSYVLCNNMKSKNLEEPGWLIKYEDDEFISILGIDISEYNGLINFSKVKDEGIDFVMIRAGWRGSTEGRLYEDKYYKDYYYEAKEAGLKIGFYFFSQAKNEDEAIEEANFVLDLVKDKSVDLFIAYDMENSYDFDGRADGLSYIQYTNNALAFCKTIEDAGYSSNIYTNQDWANNHYNTKELNDNGYTMWLAQYTGFPNPHYDYAMWQYTASASINGVSSVGRTDIDLMLIRK